MREGGISCIVDTGTAFFSLPNSSFVNLVGLFPKAVLNESVAGFPGFRELPCEERENSENDTVFTFFDPHDGIEVDVDVPAWDVIWPKHNFVPVAEEEGEGCVLNAVSWEA